MLKKNRSLSSIHSNQYQNYVIFDYYLLLDAPEVRISLGRTINGAEIKEGDDLYIECHIRSNPPTYKLQWTHNVSYCIYFYF